MNKFRFVSVFIVILASSCASISKPFYYNEIVVHNNTRDLIRDVEIRAEVSNRMFSCGNIASNARCSNKFPQREYQNNLLSVIWVHNNIKRTKNNIKLEVPAQMDKSIPLRGVLALQEDGSIKVWLEQD